LNSLFQVFPFPGSLASTFLEAGGGGGGGHAGRGAHVPGHRPTVGSQGEAVSHERGDPVTPETHVYPELGIGNPVEAPGRTRRRTTDESGALKQEEQEEEGTRD